MAESASGRATATLTQKDASFLRALETCSLPFSEWSHRAHVRATFAYCISSENMDEALQRMRDSIRRYNAANGIVDTPTTGYNETTTHAFVQLIWTSVDVWGPTSSFDDFAAGHPHLICKTLLKLFYSSSERIMSGRESFVAPDLAPLPDAQPLQQ